MVVQNDRHLWNSWLRMADTWTVFGDPSLMVRTANPNHSQHPSIYYFRWSKHFHSQLQREWGKVTLSNDGAILNTAWVSNGSATLNFPALLYPMIP
jgi:hypothetical protein